MKKYLVKCIYGHFNFLTIDDMKLFNKYNMASINKSMSQGGYLTVDIDSQGNKYVCHKCQNNYVYPIEIVDPDINYSIKKFNIRTMPRVYNCCDYWKLKSDPIHLFLDNLNYVLDESKSNYSKILLKSPDKNYIIIEGKSHTLIQNLVVIAPENNSIFKELKKINQKINSNYLTTHKKEKIKIPDTFPDKVGSNVKIGDWVAFSGGVYSTLDIGQVSKINPKSVTVKKYQFGNKISKSSDQIIKIPTDKAFLFQLQS